MLDNTKDCIASQQDSITDQLSVTITLIGDHCKDRCNNAPCLNGGTCVPDADLNGFTCKCRDLFTGDICDIRKLAIKLRHVKTQMEN